MYRRSSYSRPKLSVFIDLLCFCSKDIRASAFAKVIFNLTLVCIYSSIKSFQIYYKTKVTLKKIPNLVYLLESVLCRILKKKYLT